MAYLDTSEKKDKEQELLMPSLWYYYLQRSLALQ